MSYKFKKFLLEVQTDNQKFLNNFIDASNDMTSFKPDLKNFRTGFDRSFHMTTKIKHILVRFTMNLFDRRIETAKKRNDNTAILRIEKEKENVDKQITFLRKVFADFISNLPKNKKSLDLRTGDNVDPFRTLRQYFPNGNPGNAENDIKDIASVIEVVGGSRLDVLNLIELAEEQGVQFSPGFENKMENWWKEERT